MCVARRSSPASSTCSGSGFGTAPSVVLTMTTVQRAACEMRFGMLPSRNSFRPPMPALPTTSTSACSSSTVRTTAPATSGSTFTIDRAAFSSAASPASVSSAPSTGAVRTWSSTSSPSERRARSAAHATALRAVSDRSVATTTFIWLALYIQGQRAGVSALVAVLRTLGGASASARAARACGARAPRVAPAYRRYRTGRSGWPVRAGRDDAAGVGTERALRSGRKQRALLLAAERERLAFVGDFERTEDAKHGHVSVPTPNRRSAKPPLASD